MTAFVSEVPASVRLTGVAVAMGDGEKMRGIAPLLKG